ncbi:TadE/TadG family type IV pilus assembly protein, partial [Providencia stuartii]|uniref:TadE/TadG family type IV pilus assembly protein n=1 Tax=Providencia stuartii TaxID=588 RepID=UPI001953D835
MFEILKHAGRHRTVPVARLLRKARSAIVAFRRQTQGNVALIFAISVIPVVTSVGAAVDFSNISRDKAVLDAAADV